MKVYIASPLGFAETTRPFLRELKEALKSRGVDCLDPWDLPVEGLFQQASAEADPDRRLEALAAASHHVGRSNEGLLRDSEQVLAVLDGQEVDSGTASEVGFAYGLGKRVVGLRTDFRRSGENEAVLVNLQVQYWIEASGGSIHGSLQSVCDYFERAAGKAVRLA